jgi:hypothetical protein
LIRRQAVVDFSSVRQFFGGAPYIRWTTPDRYEQVIVGLLDSNDELAHRWFNLSDLTLQGKGLVSSVTANSS